VTLATAAFLFAAAFLGGAVNSVAGGGSFIAFPALLFSGVAPVPANATNTIALWPGVLASTVAYRRELRGAQRELVALGAASVLGGLAGSVLLLRTSDHTFVVMIPWLMLVAALLFTFGGAVSRRLLAGARIPAAAAAAAQFVVGIYGGYFGGGMGIVMLAILTLLGLTDIHRMNGLKTLLAALVNGVAVVAFVLAGAVVWGPAVVMIAGGVVGGYWARPWPAASTRPRSAASSSSSRGAWSCTSSPATADDLRVTSTAVHECCARRCL
jgi:uncharacterized membrane protein YfcA